ncbi:hypothetical protein LCGC14_0691750 [marine sediment metagenome]|uniref:HK97 gp10 family phage protein n=1 Tax=marine sediment metagenome TaxID=412755 RepID=A0A0F9T6F5_9ZZZZ
MARGAQKTRKSFKAAAKQIEKLRKNLGKRMASGLRLIGEEIMLDVKASRPGAGVPVDKGPLRASGRVEGPVADQVFLDFGGSAAPYAVVQHEDTTLQHSVGEPRYLVRGIERWKRNGESVRRAMAHLKVAVDRVAKGQRASTRGVGIGSVRRRGRVR